MALSPFEQAYADARKAGKSAFTFQGKSYSSDLKTPTTTGPSARGRGSVSSPPSAPSYQRSPAPRDTVDDTPAPVTPAKNTTRSESTELARANAAADAAGRKIMNSDKPTDSDYEDMSDKVGKFFTTREQTEGLAKGGLVKGIKHIHSKVLSSHGHRGRK